MRKRYGRTRQMYSFKWAIERAVNRDNYITVNGRLLRVADYKKKPKYYNNLPLTQESSDIENN